MPSSSAMELLYTYALQHNYIFLSWPVDRDAYISEQMEDPVTYQQFHYCATDAYCSLFRFRIVQ